MNANIRTLYHEEETEVIAQRGAWFLIEEPDHRSEIWVNPHTLPPTWRFNFDNWSIHRQYLGLVLQSRHLGLLKPWIEEEPYPQVYASVDCTSFLNARLNTGWTGAVSQIRAYEALLVNLFRLGVAVTNINIKNIRIIPQSDQVVTFAFDDAHFSPEILSGYGYEWSFDRFDQPLTESFGSVNHYQNHVQRILTTDWLVYRQKWEDVVGYLHQQMKLKGAHVDEDLTLTWED